MRIKLTPTFVQKATAIDGAERTIFWDATMPGFGLVVTKGGHKSFVVQYRYKLRPKRMAIDGVLTLDKARRQARVLLGEVARGGDPLGAKRKAAIAAKNTLASVAAAYLELAGPKLRTVEQRRSVLSRQILPELGKFQIDEIRRSHITSMLDRVEESAGPRAADMALATLSRVFTWHATRVDAFNSPIVRGMRRHGTKKRERVLDDWELVAFWRAAEAFPGPFGALLQFTLLTACRRCEAAWMRRAEISGDVWTIPSERYKVGRELVVPLSKAAQSVLARLPNMSEFVFTSSGKRPVHNFNEHKRRFDAAMLAELKRVDPAAELENWRIHDLRRTARSLMSRAGVSSDIAERCLGHVMGGIRGTYDKHAYNREKQLAFQALAALVESIINPPADNIVPMRQQA